MLADPCCSFALCRISGGIIHGLKKHTSTLSCMSERVLLLISLVVAGCGLVGLWFLKIPSNAGEVALGELDRELELEGSVVHVNHFGNVTVMTVATVVDVVVFEPVNISDEDVVIQGTVSEYNGQRQVIASRIELA